MANATPVGTAGREGGFGPETMIYVAGHLGMVGGALWRALGKQGCRTLVGRSLDELDLRRQADVEDFFAAAKPEVVFLAAARVGGILANSTAPAEFLYDNLMIAANVIHAAWRHGVRKLINLGSSCIYPKLAAQPLREDYLLTGPLEETNEAYAVAKIAALRLCLHYDTQYGTDFFSLMPTNLYGPGDNFDLASSHVLPAMIRKFHLARLLRDGDFDGVRRDLARRARPARPQADRPGEMPAAELAALLAGWGITPRAVTLWGSGKPRREFLHVEDLAEAAVFLAGNFSWRGVGGFINVGCGEDLAISELAELVRGVVGFPGEIRFDPAKPDGTPRKLLDISRIRALGWRPRIALREGIERTYQGYLTG